MPSFRFAALVSCAVLVGALAASVPGPTAWSQEVPDGGAPAAPAPDAKPATMPRIRRAQALVKELALAVQDAKRQDPVDGKLVTQLDSVLSGLRTFTKPITVAELTEEEQASLRLALGKGPGAGNPVTDAADRFLESVFSEVELSAEDEEQTREILKTWYTENIAARGDSKRRSDLKRERDKELKERLGRKRAQKIINRINAVTPGWGR